MPIKLRIIFAVESVEQRFNAIAKSAASRGEIGEMKNREQLMESPRVSIVYTIQDALEFLRDVPESSVVPRVQYDRAIELLEKCSDKRIAELENQLKEMERINTNQEIELDSRRKYTVRFE